MATPTIFDLVNASEIGSYYLNLLNRPIYLGETLFPSQKKLDLELKWIKGSSGLPVVLVPSEFDTKAKVRDRKGINQVVEEMPFFRESMRIGEKDRQELLKVIAASNQAYLEPILKNIFDDATNLVEGARAQYEAMRMQLLSTGKITVTDDSGIPMYDYDYGYNATHKEVLTSGNIWSNVSSNPISDIQRWQDTVEDDTGVRPSQAICSRKTFNYLMHNDSIIKAINPLGGTTVTETKVKEFLIQELNLQAAVYTKKYTDKTGVAKQFYPDNNFTLIPSTDLGNSWYGTTPEEADLMAGQSNAQVQVVNTGIALTTITESHPVNVQTIASMIGLPSFETIDQTFMATVV